MKRWWIVCLAVLLLAACGDTKTESSGAADFELEDVNGNTVSLSDYKNDKVYVKFWASWCSICLAGLEELNELSAEAKDFKVLTIVSPNFNNEKDRAAFVKWFKGVENTENITVLLDEDGEIAKKYGVRGYPTSAYIGTNGELIEVLPGHAANSDIINKFANIK